MLSCSPIILEAKAEHHIFWTRLDHIVGENLPQKKKNHSVTCQALSIPTSMHAMTYKFDNELEIVDLEVLGSRDRDRHYERDEGKHMRKGKKATHLRLCSQKLPLPRLQRVSSGICVGLHEHFQDCHKTTVWNLAGSEGRKNSQN